MFVLVRLPDVLDIFWIFAWLEPCFLCIMFESMFFASFFDLVPFCPAPACDPFLY